MEYKTLSNGIAMPLIGFGTYQISPEHCRQVIQDAITVGYRAIDTAQSYANEKEIGEALAASPVARHELFLTSKIWVHNAGYEKTKKSIDRSLEKLQTDYLDLMLIHQPFGDYYGSWRAMEEAYREGKLRAIGVSNFYPDRLVDFCHYVEIKPMVNQVETHVFFQQQEAHAFMNRYNVTHEAWAPFAEGKNHLFTHPLLTSIGNRYGKTAAQVALRFLVQQGIVLVVKSTHKDRMEQNMQIFDFSLSHEEIEAIRGLDTGKSLFFSHTDGKTVESLLDLKRYEGKIDRIL